MIKRDVYKEVTDRIIAQLDKGVIPWRRPWSSVSGLWPRNAVTGRRYSGINVFLLWNAEGDNRYLTYKQAEAAGGHVRKGERGQQIIYANKMKVEDRENPGKEKIIFMMKGYTVFSVEQCEGLPAKMTAKIGNEQNPETRDQRAEDFMSKTGADIRYGGNRAFFATNGNFIGLPKFETFVSSSAFYSTAFHELGHWTGHESRLNRTFGKRFGDNAYSVEELVAELTAAYLCADFGFDNETEINNTAAYIDNWRKVLKSDSKIIVSAASAASKAADYLKTLAGFEVGEEPLEEAA